MNIFEKLLQVQTKLNCPKDNYNSFGKYSYRSAEDILESLKPMLSETNTVILLSDEIVQIGDRYYIKAVAKFIDVESGQHIESSAFAREEEILKGMTSSQISGSCSSYSRKYALNGLFAIDDNKDADYTNTHEKVQSVTDNEVKREVKVSTITEKQIKYLHAMIKENSCDVQELKKFVLDKFKKTSTKDLTQAEFKIVLDKIKKT